jgi:hypothetical protein
MWSCFAYICDVRMCLWCLLAVVAAISWLVPGCSPWWLPNPGWFQDAAPGGCQILAGSRMLPATGQVTVGVSAVSVTGVNKSPSLVLTGGPQDLARSSRYRGRGLKASVSFNREKADARRNRCVSFHRHSEDAGSRNASLKLISQ